MTLRLCVGLTLTCLATLAAAQSPYKDNVSECNSSFIAEVTALERDLVSVRFQSGLTRTLSAQEKEAREALTVGNQLCLQDDAE